MTTSDSSAPPGPRGRDLFRRLRRLQRDPLTEWMDARATFGNVVCYRTGRASLLLVSHPDDVQWVLQGNGRNYRKGVLNQPLVPLLGSGLLTNDSESWLTNRRLAQPAFHRDHLTALVAVMTAEAEQEVASWRAAMRSGATVPVDRAMHRLTFAIATRALLGVSLTLDDSLGRAFATAVEHVNYRARHPLALPDWVPTARNVAARAAATELDRLVYDIVAQRRADAHRGGDVLSLLLAARDADSGEGMTDRQLRDEALTFLVAGHETSANMLAWTWHLLVQHPTVLERIRHEAVAAAGDAPIGAEHLPRLPYTRRVLEESLRLYPPSVVIPRQANGPDALGPNHVRAGTVVMVSQYVVHRHPDFWPDGDRFDPDRFAPATAASRHRFAYLPFGGGPRICIGREFALMEGQVILATLTRAFRPEAVPGARVTPDLSVTLRPRGVQIAVRPW